MSFLVPALLQGTAPAPTDPTVYLEDRAALRIAALQFDGIPHDLDFTMRGAELYGMATEAGVKVFNFYFLQFIIQYFLLFISIWKVIKVIVKFLYKSDNLFLLM
jgi:SOUL heme-binding protein